MTIARRLLVTGGGTLFVPPAAPPPVTVALTSAPNGGFNPWTIANATHASGTVFIGYSDGSSGNVEYIERDEATGTVTGPTTVKAALGADAHNSPATLVRSSDSKLLAVYCPHSQANIYRRISTNALDSTAWGSEANLDSSLLGTRYTNPQLHQLNAETNDPVYLFFRNEITLGTDSRWQLGKSTDGGATFISPSANIYHLPGARSYLVSWSDGQGRIDFLVTDKFSTSPYKIGHFYYEGGAYFKSDGTAIGAVPIQAFSRITQLYSGTDQAQPGWVSYDGNGHPVVQYWTFNAAAHTYDYWYGRWTGSAWTTTKFVTGTPAYNYNPSAGDGCYESCPDDANANVIHGIKRVAGQPQAFRWTTADGGATFVEEQLTTALSGHHATPVPVRNRGSSLLACWNGPGTWNHYTSYSLGTTGLVAAS